MLSKRRQSQEVTYYMIPFMWTFQKRQTHRDREGLLAARSCGEEGMGSDLL